MSAAREPEEDLTTREARRVARLARLSLEDEEARRLGRDLARMLAHFESLAALELAPEASQGARAGATSAPLRADEPRPSWPPELPLSRAPRRAEAEPGEGGGFYRVPKTVGGADGSAG